MRERAKVKEKRVSEKRNDLNLFIPAIRYDQLEFVGRQMGIYNFT